MGVQITATFPDLSLAIRKAAARQIQERGERYGERMVEAVQRAITANLNCGRPDSRRRYPGSQHLNDGWSYKVAGDPVNYPLFVNLNAEGDAAYMNRIHMMDGGTPGHTIRPNHAPRSSRGAWLKFPNPGDVYAKQVSHPGTRPVHFLEAARSFATGTANAAFR